MPTTITEPQPAPPSRAASEVASFRHVLKNRNFVLLWLAQLISLTILNAANFGIIVLVNDTTHSVVMAGLAIISFTLPALPFSAIAGVIVDRLHKRLILWVSNVLRAVTMLLIVASLLYNRADLWPLYLLTFMTSLIGQFFIPAEGASIPLLVGERELVPALSLFNITMTLSQAIGFLLLGSIVSRIFPPFTLQLAALTLHVQSIDMLFVLVACFYLVCTVLILCIPAHAFDEQHVKNRVKNAGEEASKAMEALWRDIVEGWRFVRNDRTLYFSVIQLSVVGNIMLLIGELAGPFVQQVLHRPSADMAIILAPAAVGLVGASIIMPRITERVGKIRLTVIGFIALAVGFMLLPTSQGLAWRLYGEQGASSPLLLLTTIVLVFILGVAMACVNIPTQTMMQEHSPEAVRGRVFALQFMMYNTGSIPILLFAGFFAQFIGFNWLIFLMSASILLFCWWGTWYIKRSM
ncbi:MAG TPA: MFS transporter [Ktedonobacteraceae bacterium]|nr:MFS transporter [Ktedonobacteraceae bacterium]